MNEFAEVPGRLRDEIGRVVVGHAAPRGRAAPDVRRTRRAVSPRVTVAAREMRVGESVRVAFVPRGGGNPWDAAPPLDTASFGDAEPFALRPGPALERRRILSMRRQLAGARRRRIGRAGAIALRSRGATSRRRRRRPGHRRAQPNGPAIRFRLADTRS
jgi:hypothetical protein